MTWKIRWKKNIKESIKENIVIFSLLFSLKNNEENRRKREGQGGENFIGGSVHRFTFPFLFIGGYGFSPSSTLSTATTITPITFQGRKPTLFRHPSSHGWSALFKSSSHWWNGFFKSSECIRIHIFRSGMNWTPIHLILWKPGTQGNRSLLGSLFGFLGCFRLARFLNFARIFLNFSGLLFSRFDMIFTLDILLNVTPFLKSPQLISFQGIPKWLSVFLDLLTLWV